MIPATVPDPVSGVPLLLAGPTASGKSAVAVALAERLNGEIVSADSMQVYRGLDVGTAKPSAADRARVPHHLLDCVDPAEGFDAARWVALARFACREIQGRGRLPIVCGGTGLYFRAWLFGLDAPAPMDPAIRRDLEARPLAELLEELRAGDPATYERIDHRNPRRVVRAVEILRAGGRRPTREAVRPPLEDTPPVFVLRRDPADLRRRIEARVDLMFAQGLVEETRRLLAAGLGDQRTPMQAIGYRQVVEHLRGERDLASTVSLVKTKTWQYARRQMTWFRHQVPVREAAVEPEEDPGRIADRITAMYRE